MARRRPGGRGRGLRWKARERGNKFVNGDINNVTRERIITTTAETVLYNKCYTANARSLVNVVISRGRGVLWWYGLALRGQKIRTIGD